MLNIIKRVFFKSQMRIHNWYQLKGNFKLTCKDTTQKRAKQ